jgi:hypothetical protein
MTKIKLLFDNLPTFERTPLFVSLDDDIDQRLRKLPDTYARCNAALRFNLWGRLKADMLGVREDELVSIQAACFRASLMEFVGMEEALPSEVTSPLRIRDTRNAMLVVLRELRNIQVHVTQSDFISTKRPAVLRWNEKEHEHELIALTIPQTDLNRLKDKRKISHYDRADFERAITWLEQAQEHWGIHDVLLQGIWTYAQCVVEAHVPTSKQLTTNA